MIILLDRTQATRLSIMEKVLRLGFSGQGLSIRTSINPRCHHEALQSGQRNEETSSLRWLVGTCMIYTQLNISYQQEAISRNWLNIKWCIKGWPTASVMISRASTHSWMSQETFGWDTSCTAPEWPSLSNKAEDAQWLPRQSCLQSVQLLHVTTFFHMWCQYEIFHLGV